MDMLKYRTTLDDFRNRMKAFRNESNSIRKSNASRLDNKLRKLLFINAEMDLIFYDKMMKYHSLSKDELLKSDVVDFNWL